MTGPVDQEAAAPGRVPFGVTTVAAIVAPGLVVFVLPALSLIARNEEYLLGRYSAGRSMYLAGLVTVLVGTALWVLSGSRLGRWAFTAYTLITPAWILYTAAGREFRAVAGLVVAIALVLVAGWLTVRPRQTFFARIGLFAAIVLVITTVATGFEVGQSGQAATGDPEAVAGGESDRPNIYHVVLDEMQTEMFEAVLDDRTRSELGGFTWFREATTTWGRTEMSMASTLAGEEYAYDVSPADYISDGLTGPASSLTQLREVGYLLTGYYHSPGLYGGGSGPFDERHLGRDVETGAPRGEYEQLVTSLWAHAYLPGSIARRVMPARQYEQLRGDVLLPDDAPVRSVANFESFLSREADRSATGRYELVHLIVPHFPYVLTPRCEHEPGVETGAEDQARCAVSLVTDLVCRLERLGRFTDATVIVHGDHGATFRTDAPGGLDHIAGDFFGEEWSAARSRALLLVKPAGTSGEGALLESDYPAILGDIMPTVFDSIDLDVTPSSDRTSLLAEDRPARPERYYHFYDKDDERMPDGEVHRYVIRDDGLSADAVIPVP